MFSPILRVAFSLSCWCPLHKVFNLDEDQRMFFCFVALLWPYLRVVIFNLTLVITSLASVIPEFDHVINLGVFWPIESFFRVA